MGAHRCFRVPVVGGIPKAEHALQRAPWCTYYTPPGFSLLEAIGEKLLRDSYLGASGGERGATSELERHPL
jgi:hypothetical protein